jgi:hypothetical protein
MPSLAHSADIERQLLAPLEALLRDAQALLGVELDADRLEEAAGATSSESSGHPPLAPAWVQSAAQGIARPAFSRFPSPGVHSAVASAQPEAFTGERGVSTKRTFERAEAAFSSPTADAAILSQPAGGRQDEPFHTAGATQPSGSPRIESTDHGAPPAPLASEIPLSPNHPAMDDAVAMTPAARSQSMSREATSTTAEDAERASMHPLATPSSARPPFTRSTPLAESLGAAGEREAGSVPAAEHTLRSDKHPEPESHPMLAIPLRSRQAPATQRSLAAPEAATEPLPGSHLLAAARRLASAVEPSLEQAYRLTQARLGTSGATVSEGIEPAHLVRNTFNVTVALRADDASTSLDPTDLADALTEVLRTAARRHGLEI